MPSMSNPQFRGKKKDKKSSPEASDDMELSTSVGAPTPPAPTAGTKTQKNKPAQKKRESDVFGEHEQAELASARSRIVQRWAHMAVIGCFVDVEKVFGGGSSGSSGSSGKSGASGGKTESAANGASNGFGGEEEGRGKKGGKGGKGGGRGGGGPTAGGGSGGKGGEKKSVIDQAKELYNFVSANYQVLMGCFLVFMLFYMKASEEGFRPGRRRWRWGYLVDFFFAFLAMMWTRTRIGLFVSQQEQQERVGIVSYDVL